MSTFARITRHPESGLYELATHHDNYFGPHTYGVEFPSNGKVYPLDLVEKKQIYDFWKDDVLAAFKVLPPNSTEVEFLNEVERQYKARWKRDPLSGEGAAVKSATIPHKAPDEGSMPSHNCGLTGHIPAGSPTTSPSSPKTDAVTSGPGTGEVRVAQAKELRLIGTWVSENIDPNTEVPIGSPAEIVLGKVMRHVYERANELEENNG